VFRLTSKGRGRNYSVARGVIESLLRVLYWGNWPATLWGVLPSACVVDKIRHRIPLLRARHPEHDAVSRCAIPGDHSSDVSAGDEVARPLPTRMVEAASPDRVAVGALALAAFEWLSYLMYCWSTL
jgi:hypothetical protein